MRADGVIRVDSRRRSWAMVKWEMSENGKEMWVSVGSDRSIRKSKDGFEY